MLHPAPPMHRTTLAAAFATILLLLSACGAASVTNQAPGQGQDVSVVVAPDTANVPAGGQQVFTATVTGTANTAVTWKVQEGASGGSVAAGTYTAPGSGGTFHVVATSVADPTKTASATVTVAAPVTPVAVSVSPGTGSVNGCQTLALTATVTGGAAGSSRAVTWSIQEGAGNGSVSSTGVYTAPDGTGTVHVVATSVADPTKSASAALTVATPILSVAVNPPTISVPTSGTTQFTATVTTTCGSTVALQQVDPTGKVTSAN